jgi:DME family drug/metabolite transporter
LSAAAGALLWGTLGPAAATLGDDELIAAGCGRLLVGAAVLVSLAGGRRAFSGWTRRDLRPVLVGGLGLAGFQAAYFDAVALVGVATSTAIGIGFSPVIAGLVAAVRSRRLPGPGLLGGMLVAVIGLLLVVFGGGAVLGTDPVGLGLSVVAAALFAIQAMSIEVLASRRSGTSAVAGLFLVGAVLLLPVAVSTAPYTLFSLENLWVVLYVGAVSGGLAYWLFARGVRRLGAAAAVTISLLEPAAAAVIAMVLLGEALGAVQAVGIALVCAAVPLVALRPRGALQQGPRRRREEHETASGTELSR